MSESPTSSSPNRVEQLRALFAELRLRYPKPVVSGAIAAPPIADANLYELGPLVRVFDPSIVARVAESGLDTDEERKSGRRRQIARQLQVSGHQRLLGACVTDALTERIAVLKASHPNFAEVSEEIERETVLAQFGNASVTGLRLLLVGPPGVGKTDYALRLAEALGVPMQLVSMSTAQASAHLGGSDEYWSNTRPGAVFEAITSGRHANPIIVLDEIEKCRLSHVGSGGDPLGALYQLLEPRSAQIFCDRSVLWLPIDARHVNWVATANSTEGLDPALLSRFVVFEIPMPSAEAHHAVLQRIYAQMLREFGVQDRLAEALRPQDLDALSGTSIREARLLIRRSIAAALQSERDVIEVCHTARAPERRIGFC